MDSQTPDQNSRASFTQIYTNLFASRRSKEFLFISFLIIALVIAGYFNGMEIVDFFSAYAITSLLLFPAGLIALISPPGPGGYDFSSAAPIFVPGALILWIVYLGIILSGIESKNIWISKFLFVVFAFLLILNIRGCAY